MNLQIIIAILPFLPIVLAPAVYLIGRKNKGYRNIAADVVCGAELVLALYACARVFAGEQPRFTIPMVCLQGLSFEMDGFRAICVLLACWLWFVTTVFSAEYLQRYRNRNRYYLFVLMSFGGAIGLFLSADLMSAFLFFEILCLSAYVPVAQEESRGALRAGDSFMAVIAIAGVVMLMGLLLLQHTLGTLRITELAGASARCLDRTWLYAAAACLLTGFGAAVGVFPLHIWRPKGLYVSPSPASALLSGMPAKAGVFGILLTGTYVLYRDEKWGKLILIVGALTLGVGAVFSLFQVDLKRTLAYVSMSQIGMILVGVGLMQLLGGANALTARGTFWHLQSHTLCMLVLFVSTGVVYMNIHRLNLNDVRGFGRKKPLLHLTFLMGVLAIAGVPGWSGYVGMTLIHGSITAYSEQVIKTGGNVGLLTALEWLFLISAGLTVAGMLKMYICLFWEKHTQMQDVYDEKKVYLSMVSRILLVISAAILPLIGFGVVLGTTSGSEEGAVSGIASVAERIADMAMPFLRSSQSTHAVSYFTTENLKGTAIVLGIGVVAYLLIVRICLMSRGESGEKVYVDRWPTRLDLENLLYRPLLITILPYIGAFFSRVLDKLTDTLVYIGLKTVLRERKKDERITALSFMRADAKESSIQREISGSFLIGVLLFAVGLSAVIVYLVVV